MDSIIIKSGNLEFPATLNDSQTSHHIGQALPIAAAVSTWGDEIYFRIPVDHAVEEGFARETVELGDLAFWPEGSCFCIFFGPTPVSQPGEIRPASTVNVIGKVQGDLEKFKTIKESAKIVLEKSG